MAETSNTYQFAEYQARLAAVAAELAEQQSREALDKEQLTQSIGAEAICVVAFREQELAAAA